MTSQLDAGFRPGLKIADLQPAGIYEVYKNHTIISMAEIAF